MMLWARFKRMVSHLASFHVFADVTYTNGETEIWCLDCNRRYG